MSSIADKLTVTITNKTNIREAISDKRLELYQEEDPSILAVVAAPNNISYWPNMIMNLPENNSAVYLGDHVDEDGIWHKPSDWPDIESIELPEDEDVVYLLYGNHLHEYSFASFTIYNRQVTGRKIIIDKGTVSNGVFTVTQNLYNGTANNYTYREMLCDSEDDYTVYRITCPLGILQISTNTMPAANNTYGYYGDNASNTCLMRYGQMKWGNNPTFRSYFIESDNIINLGQNMNQTVSIANAYNMNMRMQRWRHTGWAIDNDHLKPTSLNRFFYMNYMLSDIDPDLSGWATSLYTGSAAEIFYTCCSLRYIDLSNWNLSNASNLASMFSGCVNLVKIKGLDTWTKINKASSVASIFYLCNKLSGDYDLSSWEVSNTCTNFSGIFNGCCNIKSINIGGWDFSNATAINAMFASCYKCESIIMDDIIPITNKCTNVQGVFNATYSLSNNMIIDGWDFSGITSCVYFYNFFTSTKSKSIIFRNCTWPSTTLTNQSSSYPFVNTLYFTEYLDLSEIDAGAIYTSTQVNNLVSNLYRVVDFYPPQNINKAINISADYRISHDSIIRIFNNLATVTGSPKITMGDTNLSKLTSTEIAIATNKGWQVSAS